MEKHNGKFQCKLDVKKLSTGAKLLTLNANRLLAANQAAAFLSHFQNETHALKVKQLSHFMRYFLHMRFKQAA